MPACTCRMGGWGSAIAHTVPEQTSFLYSPGSLGPQALAGQKGRAGDVPRPLHAGDVPRPLRPRLGPVGLGP